MSARRATAGAGVVLLLLLAAACGGDDDAGTATEQTTTTTTTTTEATTSTTAPASTTTTSEPDSAELEDGRHPVYLVDVDVDGRTITFDLIQFLTGQAAVDAYHEDNPDDPEGPPNDYYIVNDNPRLRGLPVAADAEVQVLSESGGSELEPGTFEALPDHTAAEPQPDPAHLGANPWWLTVEGGQVVAIEEQFIP